MSPIRVERVLRRGVFVAVLFGVVQAVVLAAGWYVVHEDTREHAARGVEGVILQANAAAVDAVIERLGGELSVGDYGSESWARAQDIVESLELGGNGFACILDRDGNILCHPELRERSELRSMNLLQADLVSVDGDLRRNLGSVRSDDTMTGTVDFAHDGKHYVAARRDLQSGEQLLVHQPISGLHAASAEFTQGLVVRVVGVVAVVVLLTVVLAALFLRAHDRSLLRWTRELKGRVAARTVGLMLTQRAIISGIAKLAEYRDNETGMHVERLCSYSGVIARELLQRGADIDEAWIEDLELAASLHDIGKVAIPDRILLKPGRLTPREFEVMKRHAMLGEEALADLRASVADTRLLDMGIEIAGGHHEHWDGTGYPRGLSGADIPLSARIVAVADVFDALMSKRVYKEAQPFDQVHRTLLMGAGKHFDPEVVAAYEEVAYRLVAIHERLADQAGVSSLLPHRGRAFAVDPAEA